MKCLTIRIKNSDAHRVCAFLSQDFAATSFSTAPAECIFVQMLDKSMFDFQIQAMQHLYVRSICLTNNTKHVRQQNSGFPNSFITTAHYKFLN